MNIKTLRVTKAVASEIDFGELSSGELAVTTSEFDGDAVVKCREILKGKKHMISKAIVCFTHKAKPERIVIYANGSLKSINSKLEDLPMQVFRVAFRKCL